MNTTYTPWKSHDRSMPRINRIRCYMANFSSTRFIVKYATVRAIINTKLTEWTCSLDKHWRVIASKILSNKERERNAYRKYLYITYLHIYTHGFIHFGFIHDWDLILGCSLSLHFCPILFLFHLHLRSRSFILITIDRYPDLKYFYFLLLRNIVRHSNPDQRSRSFDPRQGTD